jgi:hypothetical protein
VFGFKRTELMRNKNQNEYRRVPSETRNYDDSPPRKEDKLLANLEVS